MKKKFIHKGTVAEREYSFTHHNPRTGEWYTPDTQKGTWVRGKMIKFTGRNKA